MAALLLSAARVPLAAKWPAAGERLALDTLIIVQVVASGMLFPFLLRDRWSTLAVTLTAGPMLQLAGFLSATPVTILFQLWTCLATWLLALATWKSALPARWYAPAVAIANLLTLGGVLLAYLGSEFSQPTAWSRLFPLPALTAFAAGDAAISLPLLSTAALLAMAAAARWMGGHQWKQRDVQAKNSKWERVGK